MVERRVHLNEEKHVGLLDKIGELTKCVYLSDLRKVSSAKLIKDVGSALMGITSKEYTLEQWCETIAYVLDETVDFSDEEEARAYFINKCLRI